MADWKLLLLLVLNTAASVAGTAVLKLAATSGNPVFAALGCVLWSLSALSFLVLAGERDLGAIAVASSALALLAVSAIAVLLFGEAITLRKVAALACLIAALALIAWPGAS